MLPSLPLATRSVVYLFLSWIIIILCVFLMIKLIKKIIKSCYKSLIVKLMVTQNEYFIFRENYVLGVDGPQINKKSM